MRTAAGWASKQSAQQSLQNSPSIWSCREAAYPTLWCRPCWDYAAAHYRENKLRCRDVANARNYSIAFLNKRFKSQTGTAASNILSRYRIKKRWSADEKRQAAAAQISLAVRHRRF